MQKTNTPIQSLRPPQSLFGLTAHSLLVPPFKPNGMLILGYGEGTVAGLTKMIWGSDVEIDGVDLVHPETNGYSDFFQASADRFVEKECLKRYDYVVVDLYNQDRIPDFVFSDKFVENLSKVCRKILGVNSTFKDFGAWKPYDKHFIVSSVKQVNRDKVLLFDARSHGLSKVPDFAVV